jgi:tRNA 2-thiouridine synthesizing protein C
MSSQHYLIISTAAPYSGVKPRAALDMALTAAAFEQEVTIVFRDEAVRQLLSGQETDNSGLKNIGKMIPALEMYEVKRICVHAPSLFLQGMNDEYLLDGIEHVSDADLKSLVESADQVMVF